MAPKWLPAEVPKVAASFLNHIFTFGPIYSFGVFLPPMKADFDVDLTTASGINSTMNASQFLGSLLAGLMIPGRAGHMTVAVQAAFAVLVGMLALSFANQIYFAYPAVVLAGLGLGASNLAGLTALNASVARSQRAMLVGFATCGTSVGTIVLPQFYTSLIGALGWRWAMRVNAITSAAALLAAAPLFRVSSKPDASKDDAPIKRTAVDERIVLGRPCAATGECDGVSTDAVKLQDGQEAAHKPSELPTSSPEGPAAEETAPPRAVQPAQVSKGSPFRDARFVCWWCNMVMCFLGYFAPPVLLAQFAETELHLESSVAALAYTVIGICALCTRAALGPITSACGGPRRLHFVSQVAAGVMSAILPWCGNATALIAWSAAYGLCIGPLIALISVVLSELFGTDVLPLYHGCSRMGVGLGTFCGGPLIGWVIEMAGYKVALTLAGGLVVAGTGFLVLLSALNARLAQTS